MNLAFLLRMRFSAAIASGAALATVGACQGPDRTKRQEPRGPQADSVRVQEPAQEPAPGPPDLVAAEPEPENEAHVEPAPVASTSAPVVSVAQHPPPTPAQTCSNPKRRCFAPHAQLGQVPPRPEEYDVNGCLSGNRVSGTCEGYYASKGPIFDGKQCCYVGCTGQVAPCGRSLLVEGETRTAPLVPRADWSHCLVELRMRAAALPKLLRQELAAAWRSDGLLEHAAVASFANFALELISVGAPPDAIERALAAAQDEVRHAKLCFGIAEAFAEEACGPAELDLAGIAPRTNLSRIVAAVVEEACCAETVGAFMAARQLDAARDPCVRSALSQIAEDELRHAESAWGFVAWALAQPGPDMTDVVNAAFASGIARLDAQEIRESSAEAAAFGRLDRQTSLRATREAIQTVIQPSWSALLASSTSPSVDRGNPAPGAKSEVFG